MNHEFRAWDNIDKVMKFFDFYTIHCGAYYPNHWKDSNGLACELDDKVRYPNELMHCIGETDSKGTKIYDCDIVKTTDRNGKIDQIAEIKQLSPTEWRWGHFGAIDVAIGMYNSEVIGNRYETPNLLEGLPKRS